MKVALFLALVVTAATVSSYPSEFETIRSNVYKSGEEYVYQYKGHVLSGIPKISGQFAGLLIDSLVVLQVQQDSKVILKMEKIKLYKINNKISTLPSEPLRESELTRLTGEQSDVITEQLVKPIKFRYDEGLVRDIEVDSKDRYWSINIKKGVLSLFQVTLKDKHSMTSDSAFINPDPTLTRVRSYGSSRSTGHGSVNPFWKTGGYSQSSVYKVMENDVTGNCETEYTVLRDSKESPDSPNLHVTSVRNFDNCQNKPFYIQGLFQGVYRHPSEKDLVRQTVHTDYVIKGDHAHFLIKEARLHAKYIFLINGLEGSDMSTYIVQRLTLKNTQPIRTPSHIASTKPDSLGLSMIIPKSPIVPRRESFEESPIVPRRESFEESPLEREGKRFHKNPHRERFPSIRKELIDFDEFDEFESEEEREMDWGRTVTGEKGTSVVNIVEQKLSEIIHCLYSTSYTRPDTRPGTDEKCSEILLDLTYILRETSEKDLRTLVTRFTHSHDETSTDTDYRKKEILLDILPTLSSPASSKIILELIRNKKVSDVRATMMVQDLSLRSKPLPQIIKGLLELYKELPKERSSTISAKTFLHQSLMLAVGTLTYRLNNVMRVQAKPDSEVISSIESISNELSRLLEETSSEWERRLIVKSMGNMGSRHTLPALNSIIDDPRQPITQRVNAIFALRRLVKQKELNKQTLPALVGIYMNPREHTEVRQAAVVVLFNSHPSLATLQMIAHQIRNEPNSQIRSLVYTSLLNMASFTSHVPEHKTLRMNAKLLLKSIPPVSVGVHDSLSVLINKFSEKYDLGGALNFLKIKSKNSVLPEALITNLQGTLFGKHRRLVELGVQGKSVENILRKLFGPYGLMKEIIKGQMSLSDLFKPLTGTGMGGVEHKIREIINKMKVEVEKQGEDSVFGTAYFKLLGNELQYIVFNSENIEEVIRKVTSYLPELMAKLSRGINVDVIKAMSHVESLTIASPLGIPLSLNFTATALLKVDGHVKVSNLPKWSEVLNYRHQDQLPKINIDVDLKPVVDITQKLMLGADLRWLKSSTGGVVNVKVVHPIKMNLHLNSPQHLLSLKYFVPKETLKTLHVTVKPVTSVRMIPTTPNRLPFIREEKEIHGENIVTVAPFEKKYTVGMTGVEVDCRGTYTLCGPSYCPITPLRGKHELSVILRPHKDVEYVQLKIKSLRSNVLFEGVPASHSTEEMFEEDEEELEQERLFNKQVNYRTTRKSMIESGEFEPVSADPTFEHEPIKRQILITLGPNNLQTPKIKTLITWLMGRGYWKNQLNVQVIRQAHRETPVWKIVLNNVINPSVLYNELTSLTRAFFEDESIRNQGGENNEQNPLTRAFFEDESMWNQGGENTQIRKDFERENMEHRWRHEAVNPREFRVESASEFITKTKLKWNIFGNNKEITVKIVSGSPFDFTNELNEHSMLPTDNLPEAKTPKLKYTLEVELPQMTPSTVKYMTVLHDIIKYNFYNKLTTVIPQTPYHQNKFYISLQLFPLWETMNIIVKSPREESYIRSVPFQWNPFYARSYRMHLHGAPLSSWFNKDTTYETEKYRRTVPYTTSPLTSNTCSLTNSKITTFDGVTHQLSTARKQSLKGCTIVFAQDCVGSLFSITGEGDSENWQYKMLLPNLEVQLLVRGGSIKTVINGEEKVLRIGEPCVMPPESSKPLYKIEKASEGVIELKSYQLGLTMIVDYVKTTTHIKLSHTSMLQGQICGLCGNFNQDQSDEFNVPWDFRYESRDFYDVIKKSVIPSDTCHMTSHKTFRDEVCLKENHVTISRYEKGQDLLCTSVNKVPQCSETCRPQGLKSTKVCFTCSTRTPQTLVTIPHKTYNPPKWEMFTEGVECDDFYQRMEIPTECVPAY